MKRMKRILEPNYAIIENTFLLLFDIMNVKQSRCWKLSYYNHMHDSKGIKEKCKECEKNFKWSEEGPFYPGGNDTEFIKCPYCNAMNGSIRTSGSVMSWKDE